MYIRDNVAYAGNAPETLKVIKATPVDPYILKLTFNNGVEKTFNFETLFKFECFKPLTDKTVFKSIKIDRGIPVWLDGEIDISPEYIFENAV